MLNAESTHACLLPSFRRILPAEKGFKGGLYFGKTPDPSKEMESRGSRKEYR